MDETTVTLWWISLSAGLIVTLVVALLLWWLHTEAVKINKTVSNIWDVGQRVANNTVHIPILYRIDESVQAILRCAGNIAKGAQAIVSHADGCPGCPQCMWKH